MFVGFFFLAFVFIFWHKEIHWGWDARRPQFSHFCRLHFYCFRSTFSVRSTILHDRNAFKKDYSLCFDSLFPFFNWKLSHMLHVLQDLFGASLSTAFCHILFISVNIFFFLFFGSFLRSLLFTFNRPAFASVTVEQKLFIRLPLIDANLLTQLKTFSLCLCNKLIFMEPLCGAKDETQMSVQCSSMTSIWEGNKQY